VGAASSAAAADCDNSKGDESFGADSNLLKTNDVEGNGTPAGDTTDGIRLELASAGNLVLKNLMEANVTHDCHDDSAPANTWRNNRATRRSRRVSASPRRRTTSGRKGAGPRPRSVYALLELRSSSGIRRTTK
jgi:hypothetical protein